jgi:hypothetical protein
VEKEEDEEDKEDEEEGEEEEVEEEGGGIVDVGREGKWDELRGLVEEETGTKGVLIVVVEGEG